MSFKFHVATRIRTFADQLGIDYEYIKWQLIGRW